jgi:hypothetical protein
MRTERAAQPSRSVQTAAQSLEGAGLRISIPHRPPRIVTGYRPPVLFPELRPITIRAASKSLLLRSLAGSSSRIQRDESVPTRHAKGYAWPEVMHAQWVTLPGPHRLCGKARCSVLDNCRTPRWSCGAMGSCGMACQGRDQVSAQVTVVVASAIPGSSIGKGV